MLPRCSKLSFLTCLGVLALWLCLTTAASAFTINATPDLGGSISPSGMVSVPAGRDQTFNINPDTPYVVADVVIDNSSAGAITSYTFTNVTANHTIAASFVVPSLLPYDVPVTETLSAGTEMDFFSFTGTAGDEIVLNLRTKTNNLDPNMTLRDPSGTVVESNACDAGSSSDCHFFLPHTLATSGTYLVEIAESGKNNTGEYEIVLEKLFPAITPTPLEYDVPVTDTINPVLDMDFFSFTGNAGDEIVLNLRTLHNGLAPNMSLRDPSGEIVKIKSCNPSASQLCGFSVPHTLTTSGSYLVTIDELTWGDIGDYQIVLEKLFPAIAPTPLEYDVPVTDTINPVLDMDFFSFTGNAGDEIVLNLRTLTNGLAPNMTLRDPSGEIIAKDIFCDRGASRICGFSVSRTLATSGSYLVTIDELTWGDVGEYEITLNLGEGVPSPVRLESSQDRYQTIQDAYDMSPTGAGATDTIKVKAVVLDYEEIDLNRDVIIRIEGGYDENFSEVTSNTTLEGSIKIWGDGNTVTIKDLIIK